MTAAERTLVRLRVNEHARQMVAAEEAVRGAEFCVRCDTPIEERKPRRRFCSDSCRKRHGDAHYRNARREGSRWRAA